MAAALLLGASLPATTPLMPLEEVRPGMIGVGRTVLQGTELQEFKVHILGVLKNVQGPRRDLILARLEGAGLEESGVALEFDQWRGIAAPKGTPKEVVDKLSPIVKKAVESREWIEFASSLGSTPRYQDPAVFGNFVASMDKETREIIQESGLLK